MRRLWIVVLVVLFVASVAFAGVKTYQVTGPVLELTNDSITVQKGKDKWEIARDASTKVTGDLKVGSKVTIHYEMKAASIEAKEEKGKGKGKSK
jgi:cell division protein YceG involved in septum cleavage